jgi:hypothetical protein
MSAFGGKADIIWKKADIKLAVISYLGDLRADAIEAGGKWRWTTSGIGRLLPLLLTEMVKGLAYGRSRSGFIPVLLSSFFADTNTRKGRPRNR